MLGNVLNRPRHALQRPRHALQRSRHACNVLGVLGMPFCKVLGVPHRRKPPPPTCCLISCEAKGVVYHQVSNSLGFTAYKAASEGGGFLRCGTPRTLQKGMLRTLRTLQACLGRCKACRGWPRTLPSKPTHLRFPQYGFVVALFFFFFLE